MDLQERLHSVSHVDEVSDMASAYQLCGGGLSKGTMTSTYPDARYFILSLYTTGALQAAISVLELRWSESE